MTTLWVILNDDKSAVVEVFETSDADSKRHWDKFFEHRAGNVFCRRESALAVKLHVDRKFTWFSNYYYWQDMTRWGYGDPDGIAWSACMAIPEPIKMLEFLE